MPLSGDAFTGPYRQGPGTMDNEVEARSERVCDHVRRSLAGIGNLLMKTGRNTLNEIGPTTEIYSRRGPFRLRSNGIGGQACCPGLPDRRLIRTWSDTPSLSSAGRTDHDRNTGSQGGYGDDRAPRLRQARLAGRGDGNTRSGTRSKLTTIAFRIHCSTKQCSSGRPPDDGDGDATENEGRFD